MRAENLTVEVTKEMVAPLFETFDRAMILAKFISEKEWSKEEIKDTIDTLHSILEII